MHTVVQHKNRTLSPDENILHSHPRRGKRGTAGRELGCKAHYAEDFPALIANSPVARNVVVATITNYLIGLACILGDNLHEESQRLIS